MLLRESIMAAFENTYILRCALSFLWAIIRDAGERNHYGRPRENLNLSVVVLPPISEYTRRQKEKVSWPPLRVSKRFGGPTTTCEQIYETLAKEIIIAALEHTSIAQRAFFHL